MSRRSCEVESLIAQFAPLKDRSVLLTYSYITRLLGCKHWHEQRHFTPNLSLCFFLLSAYIAIMSGPWVSTAIGWNTKWLDKLLLLLLLVTLFLPKSTVKLNTSWMSWWCGRRGSLPVSTISIGYDMPTISWSTHAHWWSSERYWVFCVPWNHKQR